MKALKTVAAGLLVLLVVLAPPYLLLRYVGNPYPPEGIDLSSPLTDNAILGLVAVLVWILWAQFTASLFVEGYAAITDRAVNVRMPVFEVQQDLARALMAAIITTTVVAPLSIGTDGPAAAAEPTPTAISSTTSSPAPSGPGTVRDQRQPAAAHSAGDPGSTARTPTEAPQDKRNDGAIEETTTTVTVTAQRGDSLWSLAETYLGDGDRWSEIAAVNSGRTMADGVVFTSAHQIRAGWHIDIPGVPPAATQLYRVQAGDTLSDIAEKELGDATRFPEIFAASRGISQPGGETMTDPDVIDVGWTVTIPPQAQPGGDLAADTTGPADHRRGAWDGNARRSTPRPTPQPDTKPDRPLATAAPRTHAPGKMAPQTPTTDTDAARTPLARSAPDTPSARESALPSSADRASGAAEARGAQEDQGQVPWVLVTGGAGVVLAGGLLLGLRSRRREQLRARRPGRVIAGPRRELSPVQVSVAASTAAAATVEHMDAALRRLAAWSARERTPMPALAAVELAGGTLVLHLTAPVGLPAPWQDAAGDQLHWRAAVHPETLASATDAGDAADAREPAAPRDDSERRSRAGRQEDTVGVDAPYPLLVTVGSTPGGEVWLLNLEELGEVRLTGDVARGRDLTRYLVAELAMNPWSDQARVDCVAIAAEVAPMNPDRIGHHHANDLEDTAAAAIADAVTTIDRAATADSDPVTGRTGQLDEDVWPARMVVIDATEAMSGPAQGSPGQRALQRLRTLVSSHAGRTGTAVVLVGEDDPETSARSEEAAAVEIRVYSDGRLKVASVGLELMAVGLSAEEALGCAALLTQSEDLDDVEVPVDETAEDGWEAYVDTAGALRQEYTVPRTRPAGELTEPVGSVLDAPTQVYVEAAAATAADVETLAPRVPVRLRAEIEAKDPRLDQDVTDWFDETCRRPRLVLLGPVTARAYGTPLTKRKPYMAELLAYLAAHRRHGVTAARLASAFHITIERARTDIQIARAWLGTNPRTGQPYLPHATKSPSAQVSGVGVYQLDRDVLVDHDLFRRLRARGQARNADGITDLRTALALVSGRPFDQLRDGGWDWMPPLEADDVASAVADVAFLVTTHCLERGRVEQARAAANVATLVAPDSDAARLCLARVVEAEGDRVEAERIVLEQVCNRSDDGKPPTELSERTQAIIRNRRWLTGARKTS